MRKRGRFVCSDRILCLGGLLQPHDFNIPDRFLLQFTAATNTIEISVDVELQQIAWRIRWSPSLRWLCSLKPSCLQVKLLNKSINEPHRVIIIYVFVYGFWKKDGLLSRSPLNISHRFSPGFLMILYPNPLFFASTFHTVWHCTRPLFRCAS